MPNRSPGPVGDAAERWDTDAGGVVGRPAGAPPSVRLVERAQDVPTALEEIAEDLVGVDVERADADRYHRHAALVQVGIAGRCVLLDGVALADLGGLDTFLAGRTAVFHALENDLDPLASKQVRPARLADTAIAAGLLGLPTGLGPLLAHVLGVELGGDKSRFQRADWEARPLTDGMIGYAAGDVVHLPELWLALAARLQDADRTAWYDEELERVVARAGEQQRSWRRVKGVGKLSGEQRAVIRSVWEERERLAITHDIAPNRLLHDEVIREIAVEPPGSAQELVKRSSRRRSELRPFADELFAAVEAGRERGAEPRVGTKPEAGDRSVFDALRSTRARVADELGLDVGLLCPAQPLWSAVTGEPGDGVELCRLAGVDGWRTEVLAEPLWEAYVDARNAQSE